MVNIFGGVTTLDIAWAAGFIEGEGSFYHNGNSLTIRAAQVQKEPLERLRQMFGGKIGRYRNGNHQPIHQWYVHGRRAAGIIMTLFVLLSPRRKGQAEQALNDWKARPVAGHDRKQCENGHEYKPRRRGDRTGRYCPICNNS